MTVAHPEIRVKITALQAELRRLTGSTALIVYAVEETRTRSHEEVKKAVSEATGMDIARILKRTRKGDIVFARQLLCYCMRRMCGMSYPRIAEFIGYRDHSCVMYSENEVQDRLKNGDWETAQAMRKVESYFENTAA